MLRNIFSRSNIRLIPQLSKYLLQSKVKPLVNKSTPKLPTYGKLLGFSLLGFLGGTKELNPEDELIMAMKRGILCTQRGEFNKAEQILHVALGMAQKQRNEDAITYIYDLMANLAMEKNEPIKAKKLFVSVMERLFQQGVEQDDIRVVHISLKLANIHAKMGYINESIIGYKWCIEKLQSKTDNDSLLLKGITLDYYGQTLAQNKQYAEGIKCMTEAFEICRTIMGKNSEQTLKLMNDLASICWEAGDLEKAEKYFRDSLVLAKDINEIYVAVLKSNLGILLIEKGLVKEAEVMCKDAWQTATRGNDEAVVRQANYCLDQLNKVFVK